MSTQPFETAFTMDSSRIKYGPGVTGEVGLDMKILGTSRVLVVTDPVLADSEPVEITTAALRTVGIDAVIFDKVRIEPTDQSFKEAISFAADGGFDGYVAIGGGSTIDTAKAANLYATYPASFLDYVNPPIGKGGSRARSAKAAHRNPNNCRHRQRDDGRGYIRFPGNACQNGYRIPRAASRDGYRGSTQHAHPATHGDGLFGSGHLLPCHRVTNGYSL